MDPLDEEKPWGVVGQMVLIVLAIGLIYLIIRLAVVVPEYGWQLVAAMSVIAPLLYYFLAFRSGRRRPAGAPPRFTRAQRIAQAVTAVLLAAVLSVPAFVAAYYYRVGMLPWE